MSRRALPRSPSGPLVIGHRGAPGYRPELTRASLLLAIEQGADAVEIDVVPSRDGVLVLRHDRALAGTTDIAGRRDLRDRRRPGHPGRAAWFTDDLDWADLATLRARERLPRLRPGSATHDGQEGLLRLVDALQITAEADVALVIEIKDALALTALGLDPIPLLRADLARAPRLPRIVFECFEKTALLGLADLGLPLVYLLEARGTPADAAQDGSVRHSSPQELADPAFLTAFDGLSLPASRITASRVERLHDAGLAVWTWTLRPENRFLPHRFRTSGPTGAFGRWEAYWTSLLAAGVDGVFADHPDLAVAVRAATG